MPFLVITSKIYTPWGAMDEVSVKMDYFKL